MVCHNGRTNFRQTMAVNLLNKRGHKTTIEHARHYLDTQSAESEPTSVDIQLDGYSFRFLSRSAFIITETELNVIAALAIIGERSTPTTG